MKRTDVSDDGLNRVHVASRGSVWSFDLMPPSIRVPALPRPLGPDRCFVVGKHVYWTENHDNAKLEFKAVNFDYDMDVLQETKHTRFLRYPEPTGNNEDAQEKSSSGRAEPTTVVYADYDAARSPRGTPRAAATPSWNRQPSGMSRGKDSRTVTVVPWSRLTGQCPSTGELPEALLSQWTARYVSWSPNAGGCSEDPGWSRLLRHHSVWSRAA